MAKPLLLIAGIPAAGKSHFSEWLESRHEFLYLEVYNHDPRRDRSMVSVGLEKEWACCWQGNACSQFVEALRERRKAVVLEWGFPVRCIQAVRALKEGGFSIWWFDADYEVARKKFVERARDKVRDFDSQMRDFDVQMRGIEKQWLNIKALFDPNIITTLDKQGNLLDVEEIFLHIVNGSGSSSRKRHLSRRGGQGALPY